MRKFISALILILALAAVPAIGGLRISSTGSGAVTEPLTLTDITNVLVGASLDLGHATDSTLTRASAGNLSIEGNAIYRAGGTDVPVTDGGTGASTAAAARGNLGVLVRIESAASNTFSPADSTTYYATNNASAMNTTEDMQKTMYVPAGTVVRVCCSVYVAGVNGSNESVTHTVRKNGVDTTMTYTTTWDGGQALNAVHCVTTNTFTVAESDYLTLATATPAWATNPTNVRLQWWVDVRTDQ